MAVGVKKQDDGFTESSENDPFRLYHPGNGDDENPLDKLG
jgi:hypothetical protein